METGGADVGLGGNWFVVGEDNGEETNCGETLISPAPRFDLGLSNRSGAVAEDVDEGGWT